MCPTPHKTGMICWNLEESANNVYNMDKPTWILDPVDGTINISHNFKHSAISLALFIDRKPVMGIIYTPYLKEMFHAVTDRGAFINGSPMHVSLINNMKDSLIMF